MLHSADDQSITLFPRKVTKCDGHTLRTALRKEKSLVFRYAKKYTGLVDPLMKEVQPAVRRAFAKRIHAVINAGWFWPGGSGIVEVDHIILISKAD